MVKLCQQDNARNAGEDTIEYDLFNRMVKYEKGTDVYTYTYNGDGQRMSKTVNGTTTNFVWDGMDMILEHVDYFNNTGYYYGPGGVEFQQYSDGLHLAAAYVKNALGDVVGTYDVMYDVTLYREYCYDAYGNAVEEYDNTNAIPPSENPFRYRGEYYDAETGLYYLRNRYYDPKAGRFITEDTHWNTHNMIYGDNPDKNNPVPDMSAIKQSGNLYAYCSNDPINRRDLSGDNWTTNVGLLKEVQRAVWRIGAQKLLREKWGYETSAWLLEHSLQDNPSDQWRGNDSRIAGLIKEDSAFTTALTGVMSWADGLSSDATMFWFDQNVEFNNGDLFYAIHGCSITFAGTKREDGSWIVNCTMTDVYDYTEISFSMGNMLGTVANDAAVVSSNLGAINPYKITVEFQVEWP